MAVVVVLTADLMVQIDSKLISVLMLDHHTFQLKILLLLLEHLVVDMTVVDRLVLLFDHIVLV